MGLIRNEGVVDEIIDLSGGGALGRFVPAIGGNMIAQSELVTWWLTLFAFSMLARYKPQEWTSLLNVDDSVLAVPVEQIMGFATERVPFLLAKEISRLSLG